MSQNQMPEMPTVPPMPPEKDPVCPVCKGTGKDSTGFYACRTCDMPVDSR